MMCKKNSNIVLPIAMIGAVILSGIGFLGLIVSSIDFEEDEVKDRTQIDPVSSELDVIEVQAELRFDESFHEVEGAKKNAPTEMDIPISKGYDVPQTHYIDAKEGSTRSSEDLLDDSEYIQAEDVPEAPDMDMEETIGLLNGKGQYLGSAQEWIGSKEAPDELEIPDVDNDVELPVTEEGMDVETDKISDVSDDIEALESEIGGFLGEQSPDTTSAGISKESLSGMTWSFSNKTTKDQDGDGFPELITEVRVATGQKNNSLLNGSLSWITGFEHLWIDDDSDGIPNREELLVVSYANYTLSGTVVAEGISFSSFLMNDTDSDGTIDTREFRHLSYGMRATLIGTIRSYAAAGELIEKDTTGDGSFDEKEATAVFYFKHETSNATLRESFVMVSGKIEIGSKELSKLAFTRLNNTEGKVLLEVGYIWSYTEKASYENLVIIAARNNTVTGRLQYAIFNVTESMEGSSTVHHITAFAVDNRTLLLGGVRSDALALDYDVTIDGSSRTESGFLAASRNDDRPVLDTESFLLISIDRKIDDTVTTYENITVISRINNTRKGSLNSTMGYIFREYMDQDSDGNPELLKEALAISISRDADSDGTKEWESYAVTMKELRDNDSDGNLELNHTFTMMGIKTDPDDDGNTDVERGLMVDVKKHDTNSNGFLELIEEGMVGFVKTDDDSDGLIDHEKYMGFWKQITDTFDDGTEVTESSGTWTNETP